MRIAVHGAPAVLCTAAVVGGIGVGLFFNLENLDTNRRDFHGVPLRVECRYAL